MMQAELRGLLLASVPLGEVVGDRINWVRRPQGETGAGLVLHLIGEVVPYHFKGAVGLDQSRVQIDAIADDYADAVSVADLVKEILSAFQGDVGGTRFEGIFVDARRDDDDNTGAETLFRVSRDFVVNHKEATQ